MTFPWDSKTLEINNFKTQHRVIFLNIFMYNFGVGSQVVEDMRR